MDAYQRSYFGVDKIGRPFYIDRSGSINVPAILKATTLDRMWQRYYYSYEELLKLRFGACSNIFDRQICQCMNVVDLTGFSVGKLWNK